MKYNIWKYGEETALEMENEEGYFEEEDTIDPYTVIRSNILARAVFLFCT